MQELFQPFGLRKATQNVLLATVVKALIEAARLNGVHNPAAFCVHLNVVVLIPDGTRIRLPQTAQRVQGVLCAFGQRPADDGRGQSRHVVGGQAVRAEFQTGVAGGRRAERVNVGGEVTEFTHQSGNSCRAHDFRHVGEDSPLPNPSPFGKGEGQDILTPPLPVPRGRGWGGGGRNGNAPQPLQQGAGVGVHRLRVGQIPVVQVKGVGGIGAGKGLQKRGKVRGSCVHGAVSHRRHRCRL